MSKDLLDLHGLPHAVDAEKSVFGAILLDNSLMDEAMEMLKPSDLFLRAHQCIFVAMREVHRRKQPIDLITLTEQLRSERQLELVGGQSAISALIDYVPRTDTLAPYATVIQQKAQVRAIYMAANNIESLCLEEPGALDLATRAQQILQSACDREATTGFVTVGEAAHRYLEVVEAIRNNESGGESIFTGFDDLDRFTLGLGRGDLIILAGRPSNGKTTLAENIAMNVASRNLTVAFFSQEMLARQIGEKAVSAAAKVDSMRLRIGCPSDADWKRAVESLPVINQASLHICDLPNLSSAEMKAKAMRLKREHGLDAVFVDYLQLMAGERHLPKRQVVGNNANDLKTMAKELNVNVPVVALSQLSRAVAGRAENEPELSDLAESGDIEQVADVVLFIYNELDKVAGDVATDQNRQIPQRASRLCQARLPETIQPV
jgi:replicative DNA helicase